VKPNRSVRRSDLEEALAYLEGLETVLRRLHEEQRGRVGDDDLLNELYELHGPWEPLRYQSGGVGTGWDFVAANVADLRARLAERFRDAAQ
jgi:hypothetical protein